MRKSLFIGYVHPSMIPHHFMECVFEQVHDGTLDYMVNPCASGPLIAGARNHLVEKFLESRCDYFLSVDTDIEWGPHQVHELIDADKDIVSGLYRSHGEKGIIWPVYLKLMENGTFERPEWSDVEDATELMPVGAVGMGFCLIKRVVFEKLGTRTLWPFAEVEGPLGTYQGEDVTFCVRAKAEGFETYLDPNIKVFHNKLIPV